MRLSPTAYIPPLIAALAVNLVAHIRWLPWWVVFGCVAGWLILLFRIRAGLPIGGRRTRRLWTLIGILAVVVGTGGVRNPTSAVALLWVLATVKLLEVESRRDVVVSVFLAYFLAVSVVFFATSLVAALYVPVGLWFTTTVLVRLHDDRAAWRRSLKVSARLLLQAVPIAAVLFLFFPRVHGSLWGFGAVGQPVSGFSDVLAPGTVSGLVLSREVAFRVEFESPPPDIEDLYWRGLSFDTFDGRAWRRSGESHRVRNPVSGGRRIHYTIALEPHGRQWLFTLDLPIQVHGRVAMHSDYTVTRWRKVREKYTYTAESRVGYHAAGSPGRRGSVYLQLPARGNPRSRSLARKLRGAAETPAEVVALAMRFLGQSGFRYTLNPPLLEADPVDALLFETRQGYCEHYASAFAFLMRAAGIPARVVAGYLGGEPNPYADYWIVRQLHAHAWVEVWLPQSGWTRRDPTLAVEPNRMTRGAADALPLEEREAMQPLRGRLGALSGPWEQLQLGWDMVETRWNRWVIGYSADRQRSILGHLGLDPDKPSALLVLLSAAAALCSLLVFVYLHGFGRFRGNSTDQAQRSYLIFCDRLARAGLVRRPHEGPLDFASRVGTDRPDLAADVNEIVWRYVHLRYGNRGGREALRVLRRRVRHFRPPRKTRCFLQPRQ